jgi:hypothetical protein
MLYSLQTIAGNVSGVTFTFKLPAMLREFKECSISSLYALKDILKDDYMSLKALHS